MPDRRRRLGLRVVDRRGVNRMMGRGRVVALPTPPANIDPEYASPNDKEDGKDDANNGPCSNSFIIIEVKAIAPSGWTETS